MLYPHDSKMRMKQGGFMLMVTLVFGAVFLTIISSLAGFLLMSKKIAIEKEAREKALNIAEAGLDYYRWHLAHFPTDMKDGTNASGPYAHSYADPEGGVVGTFSLTINGNQECGQVTTVDLSSTGASSDNPVYTRTVTGRYTRPSVAQYSYIVNTNVWAGADRVITGKYHSNGGVRMDGSNNSAVESSVATWQCTSSFGCTGTQTKNGVFGAGSNPALWKYPTPQIDFAGISVDLAAMKTYAQNSGGLYFAALTGNVNSRGYHVIFKSNATMDVYRVTATVSVPGYSDESGWQTEYNIISAETLLGNYAIPSACSLAFFEDRVWIEGVVKGKVTIASANITQSNVETDILLRGNITYALNDGTDGLTAIAERNVLIPLTTPDDMALFGIFIAQTGRYGRNYYVTSGSNQVPSTYDQYVERNSLTTVGTIVSNGRTGTQWTCSGAFCGGYETRTDSYDGRLANSPPPFTPYISSDYTFVEWREVN